MIDKKILIIDTASFSRVCSAILENEGFRTDTIIDSRRNISPIEDNDVQLVITSYPYGNDYIDEIKGKNIPVIILSEQINRDVINILEYFEGSYCMIKPLDYKKFTSLVKQIMSDGRSVHEGYNIV